MMRAKTLSMLLFFAFTWTACSSDEPAPTPIPIDVTGVEIDESETNDADPGDVPPDQDTAADTTSEMTPDADDADSTGMMEPSPEWAVSNVALSRVGEPKWQVTEAILVNMVFGAGVESGRGYQSFFECVISPWNGLDGDQVIPIAQPVDSAMMPIGAGRALNERAQVCILSSSPGPWQPAFAGQGWGAALDFSRDRGVMFVAAVEPTRDAPRGRSLFAPDEPIIPNQSMPLSIRARTTYRRLGAGNPLVWQGSLQLEPITRLQNTADPACQSDPNACMNFDLEGFTNTAFALPVLSVERDMRSDWTGIYDVEVAMTDSGGQGWSMRFSFDVQ